ncbi:MAG: SUMF1/EgtB/PvdO family nonheme iron enzyme [Planctomycetota bacterium]
MTALPSIALATLLLAPGPNAGDDTPFVDASKTPPPGMLMVKPGRIKMGSTPKEVTDVLEMSKSHHGPVRLFDGETPQHSVTVGAFAIGKFEVTNEQYEAYARATKAKPPEHWAVEAINGARAAFLEAEGLKAKTAREAGERYSRKTWTEQVKEKWWSENWQDAEWNVPAGEESKPVNFVDYEDVSNYCRWAGLRLPTESEWTAAARGTSKSIFPWGDEWEATGRAHTEELHQRELKPVGSLPEGAGASGALDMGGSVFEWTSSPYNAFPKYKAGRYKGKVGKDKFDLAVNSDFRSSQKVIKGGCYGTPLFSARVAFRQGTRTDQTADMLGFRAASSIVPGADLAAAEWKESVKRCPVRRDEADIDVLNITGIDRWRTKAPAGKRPEGYALVEDYDALVFVPRGNLDLKPGSELNSSSRVWPVTLGEFVTTMPIAEPALEPGAYLVMYRGKGRFLKDKQEGKANDGENEGEAEEQETQPADDEAGPWAGIDTKSNILIFCRPDTGEVAATLEVEVKKDNRFKDVPSNLTFESGERIVGTGVDRRKEAQDWLSFEARLPFANGKRAVPVLFSMRLPTGTFGTGWRR